MSPRPDLADRSLPTRAIGYCWALPCSLLGVLVGVLLMLPGGRLRRVSGVLEISMHRGWLVEWLPFSAITFGHVVIGKGEALLETCRAHEQEHVRQYERWGLFFLLAYPLASLLAWLRGRDAYWFNGFEVQARRRCGEERAPPDEPQGGKQV